MNNKAPIYWVIAIIAAIFMVSTLKTSGATPIVAGFISLIMVYLASYENNKARKKRREQEAKKRAEHFLPSWTCPQCSIVNQGRNQTCAKCGCKKP